MATSGTTAFAPTLTEIFEEAWELATGGELRFGHQARTVRRSLNLLLLEWQNNGYNLWMVTSAAVPCVIGNPSLTLPATCVDVVEATCASPTATLTDETPLQRTSLPDYAVMPNKMAIGRPIQMLVNRQASPATLTLYPTPDKAYTVTVWYLRRLQDAGDGENTADVPVRFVDALVYGLAYRIASKVTEGRPRMMDLQMQYQKALDDATSDDREKAALIMVPSVAAVC